MEGAPWSYLRLACAQAASPSTELEFPVRNMRPLQRGAGHADHSWKIWSVKLYTSNINATLTGWPFRKNIPQGIGNGLTVER
ncbi:hypothetical protein PCAR4_200041 [Paraburkholderia caribensis]|nr:hypothetical protein PCAR4_200041 [Paraburkholderia caribensis]